MKRLRVTIPHDGSVLSADALAFLELLGAAFGPRVAALRERRHERALSGAPFDFLPETQFIRDGDWTVAPLPHDLLDRRVEITGPCDRKMVINALNAGANVFMADFEDSTSPTFGNLLTGQRNLMEAVRRTLTFVGEGGRQYALAERTAVLFVRPRGWHLDEAHLLMDGQAFSASLFDFGLYFFHNAKELVGCGSGPYFYLPKMESHLEAQLWNDVFVFAQQQLGLPVGTIKATCLIETLPAAFEMDEILHALRDHSAGLNCGRWDYIFSYIKKLAQDPSKILPDRVQVTMDRAFLRAYTQLLIKTCHRRHAHAMGGMAAQIPIKNDAVANDAALAKVRADKLREAREGHDGTWVAHPGLVPLARQIFDAEMPGPNQIHRRRDDVHVTAADLLQPTEGTRTEAGLRHNVRVGVQYLEAWLRGIGCVPLYNLMEDAATAEICRAQTWQWIRHGATLEWLGDWLGNGLGNGQVESRPLTRERFSSVLREELQGLRTELGEARFAGPSARFAEAQAIFADLCTAEAFEDFLTLPAYRELLSEEKLAAGVPSTPALQP